MDGKKHKGNKKLQFVVKNLHLLRITQKTPVLRNAKPGILNYLFTRMAAVYRNDRAGDVCGQGGLFGLLALDQLQDNHDCHQCKADSIGDDAGIDQHQTADHADHSLIPGHGCQEIALQCGGNTENAD